MSGRPVRRSARTAGACRPHRTTDGPTCGDQFFAYPLRAHVGEPRMPPRVVADGVTVTVHTPDLAGVGVGWTAGDEEGRVRVVAAQRGQQPRGSAKDHRRTSDREPCRWSGDRPRPRTSPGVRQPLRICAGPPPLFQSTTPLCRRLEVGSRPEVPLLEPRRLIDNDSRPAATPTVRHFTAQGCQDARIDTPGSTPVEQDYDLSVVVDDKSDSIASQCPANGVRNGFPTRCGLSSSGPLTSFLLRRQP